MGPTTRIWQEMDQACSTQLVDQFGIFGHQNLFPDEWEISKWNKIEKHEFWNKKSDFKTLNRRSSSCLEPRERRSHYLTAMSARAAKLAATEWPMNLRNFLWISWFLGCLSGYNHSTSINWNPMWWFHSLPFHAIEGYHIIS